MFRITGFANSGSSTQWIQAMAIARVVDRLQQYALLMRLDKPIGAFLLLWPTLWSLWLAGAGQPSQQVVIIFLLGVFLMRSAGCVINDVADRDFDPHVARTRERPLAARRVSLREALGLFVGLCLTAFALVLALNTLTILLAVAGALLTATYPFMKRFHYLPQAHLGAAFGWSIPMAFAALTGAVPAVGWILFAANIVWSIVYDTQYAMTDRADDLKIGLKSSAIWFGDRDKEIVAYLQILVLLLLLIVGLMAGLGPVYYFGLFVAVWFSLYQQYLMRDREPASCFKAFLNNNWFGLAVFAGLALDLLP